MLTPMLPTVVSSWLDVLWVVDHYFYTQGKVWKSSSVAVLGTFKPVRLAPTTISCSKGLKYFDLPIHPLNGKHECLMLNIVVSMYCLKECVCERTGCVCALHWLRSLVQSPWLSGSPLCVVGGVRFLIYPENTGPHVQSEHKNGGGGRSNVNWMLNVNIVSIYIKAPHLRWFHLMSAIHTNEEDWPPTCLWFS
jgi:hypothetical protein